MFTVEFSCVLCLIAQEKESSVDECAALFNPFEEKRVSEKYRVKRKSESRNTKM